MKTRETLGPNCRIAANKQMAACDLDGEMVILNLDSGVYFGLNPVGASIWNYIQAEHSLSEVVDHLTAEYRVSRDQCQTEVTTLLQNMVTHGLIEIHPYGETA